MCRLAYIPPKAKVSRKMLARFFAHLERSCGGDGNGLLLVGPDGTEEQGKGVKLTALQCAAWAAPMVRKGWSCYFHTRRISVGWTSDEQCHPHRIKGGKFFGWLCHNGTWMDGEVLARYFGCGSDTAALAKVIGALGIEEAEKREVFPRHGVFLLYGGATGETPLHRAIHLGGSLQYCPETGIWASEFPLWMSLDAYSVAHGKHLLCKPAPQMIEPKAISPKFGKAPWQVPMRLADAAKLPQYPGQPGNG